MRLSLTFCRKGCTAFLLLLPGLSLAKLTARWGAGPIHPRSSRTAQRGSQHKLQHNLQHSSHPQHPALLVGGCGVWLHKVFASQRMKQTFNSKMWFVGSLLENRLRCPTNGFGSERLKYSFVCLLPFFFFSNFFFPFYFSSCLHFPSIFFFSLCLFFFSYFFLFF